MSRLSRYKKRILKTYKYDVCIKTTMEHITTAAVLQHEHHSRNMLKLTKTAKDISYEYNGQS